MPTEKIFSAQAPETRKVKYARRAMALGAVGLTAVVGLNMADAFSGEGNEPRQSEKVLYTVQSGDTGLSIARDGSEGTGNLYETLDQMEAEREALGINDPNPNVINVGEQYPVDADSELGQIVQERAAQDPTQPE